MPRLFIALPLPSSILEQLADLSGRLKKGFEFTPCRPSWTGIETMHLTLRFLGETDPARVEPISEALAEIAARFAPLRLRGRELGVFPHWRHPKVLWAGIAEESGALTRLQGEIEAMAVTQGYEGARTPFRPHLTLARFRTSRGIAEARRKIEAHDRWKTEPFQVGEVVLFESELRPEGAKHRAIKSFALSAI